MLAPVPYPVLAGHCHYANRSQLTIIDVFRRYRCHERERYPQYYQVRPG